jgi:hypothetical protein
MLKDIRIVNFKSTSMLNFTRFFFSFIFCLVFMYGGRLFAQDANYWHSGFGPGGLLTPGATIVNDRDSGLYYYNPALMALRPKNSVSISTNLYKLGLYNIKDGVGAGKNLKSSGVQIIPLMVSGNLFFKGKKTIALGYSLVHDPVSNYQVTQRQDKKMNVLDDSYSPGIEDFIGQYASHNKVSNTVASGSLAVKLDENWSVGLTAEAQLRSQDYLEQYSARALINSNDTQNLLPMTNVESSYQINYWNIGLRFKFGTSYDHGPHHLGLLISAPRVNIKGNATITNDLIINDLHPVPGTPLILNVLGNGRQTGLPVTYKEPFSVALGYGLDFGNGGEIFLTGEYFSKVNRYNIVSPLNASFVRPDNESNRSMTNELLQFNEQRKSVTNFSIGIKQALSPKFIGYASFRTDFNYDDNGVTVNSEFNGHHPNLATWNTYHGQFGINVKRRKGNLHAGLLLSYGATNSYVQPFNFDTPNEDNQLQGTVHTTTAKYFSAGLLLGYIFNL